MSKSKTVRIRHRETGRTVNVPETSWMMQADQQKWEMLGYFTTVTEMPKFVQDHIEKNENETVNQPEQKRGRKPKKDAVQNDK